MASIKYIIPWLFLLLVAGCAHGPAKWAKVLIDKVECGMSVAEVQALTRKPLKELDPPPPPGTHLIRSGSTDLWFEFVDGKLRAVQAAWAVGLMKVHPGDRIDLCSNSGSSHN